MMEHFTGGLVRVTARDGVGWWVRPEAAAWYEKLDVSVPEPKPDDGKPSYEKAYQQHVDEARARATK